MTALLSPPPRQTFFIPGTNEPASGYRLHTYATGTQLPQATYKDRARAATNTNPIILDTNGQACVYLDPEIVYDYWLESPTGSLALDQKGVSAGGVTTRPASVMDPRFAGGAKGDGTTDDTAAFNAAAAASGSVYVPPGTYYLAGTVTFTNKAVHFYGAGRGISILKFGSVDIGIEVDNSLEFSPVDIADMSITTTNTLGGTAIDIVWPETFDGRLNHKGTIFRVQIEGFDNVTNGWNKGIRYTQACFVSILECGIMGRDTGGTADQTQTAKTASQIGIEFVGGVFPVEMKVKQTAINCWDTGFSATGAPEGLDFLNSTWGQCRIGVYVSPTEFSSGIGGGSAKFRPLVRVADCHMSVFQTCVWSDAMVQSIIHDNLFYVADRGNQDALMLAIFEAGGFDIHNNQFYQFASTYQCNGIVVQDSGASGGEVYIRDNVFGSMNTGIWMKSDVSNVRYGGNKFKGTYTTSAILDQGTQNYTGPLSALASLTASTWSLPNGADTAVNFDSETYDYGGFFPGTGGVFTIPAGVHRVRLSAHVTFAGNATGFRTLAIAKNGTTVYPGTAQAGNASPGTASVSLSVRTPILNVIPGDTFTVQAFQNSGAALNVMGSSASWAAIEAIDA